MCAGNVRDENDEIVDSLVYMSLGLELRDCNRAVSRRARNVMNE